MNSKTYEVDGMKLRAELKRVFPNNTEADIARMIGFEPSYFHNVVKRNKIGKVAVLWLEGKGIPLESYLPTKEEPKEELPELTPTEELNNLWQQEILAKIEEVKVRLEKIPDMRFISGQDSALTLTKEELMNVIYKAVYSAVKHAWEEPEGK